MGGGLEEKGGERNRGAGTRKPRYHILCGIDLIVRYGKLEVELPQLHRDRHICFPPKEAFTCENSELLEYETFSCHAP